MLFALGWDVNQALCNTEPPMLSLAVAHDDRLASWLLQKGANPNATCSDIDYTPLSIAVTTSSFSLVELLLQNAQHSHNGHLVYYATQRVDEPEQMIRLLHNYGKPIDDVLHQDIKSSRFRAQFLHGTPLYYACKDSNLLVALTLLELGADPDKPCVRWNESVRPSPRQVAREQGWNFPGFW